MGIFAYILPFFYIYFCFGKHPRHEIGLKMFGENLRKVRLEKEFYPRKTCQCCWYRNKPNKSDRKRNYKHEPKSNFCNCQSTWYSSERIVWFWNINSRVVEFMIDRIFLIRKFNHSQNQFKAWGIAQGNTQLRAWKFCFALHPQWYANTCPVLRGFIWHQVC